MRTLEPEEPFLIAVGTGEGVEVGLEVTTCTVRRGARVGVARTMSVGLPVAPGTVATGESGVVMESQPSQFTVACGSGVGVGVGVGVTGTTVWKGSRLCPAVDCGNEVISSGGI